MNSFDRAGGQLSLTRFRGHLMRSPSFEESARLTLCHFGRYVRIFSNSISRKHPGPSCAGACGRGRSRRTRRTPFASSTRVRHRRRQMGPLFAVSSSHLFRFAPHRPKRQTRDDRDDPSEAWMRGVASNFGAGPAKLGTLNSTPLNPGRRHSALTLLAKPARPPPSSSRCRRQPESRLSTRSTGRTPISSPSRPEPCSGSPSGTGPTGQSPP